MKKLLSIALLIAALRLSAAAQDPGTITTGYDKTTPPPPPPPITQTAATEPSVNGEDGEATGEDAALTLILSVLNTLLTLS